MEDFVLVVLVLAVLWLFIRTRGRAADRRKLAEHNDLIGRLHQRVLLLEEAARAASPATQQPVAEPIVRGGPFPAAVVATSAEQGVPQLLEPLVVAQTVAVPVSVSVDAVPQDIVLPMPSAPYETASAAEAAELPTEIPAAHVPPPPPPPKRHVSF